MTVAELMKILGTMDKNLDVVIAIDVPCPEVDIMSVEVTKGYYSNRDVVEITV
jgi:hypothetical protein